MNKIGWFFCIAVCVFAAAQLGLEVPGAAEGIQGKRVGDNFNFVVADFEPMEEIQRLYFVGAAARFQDALRITNNSHDQAGAVWWDSGDFVGAGFESTFAIRITDSVCRTGEGGSKGEGEGEGQAAVQRSGEGFAFVLTAASVYTTGPLGYHGGALGYGGDPDDREGAVKGISFSVAIEFDTFDSSAEILDDPANHISVNTRGREPNSSDHTYSLGSAMTTVELADGNVHNVMIEYVPGTLSVFLDDFSSPALDVPVNILEALGQSGNVLFVGFTAATGNCAANHELLSWSYMGVVPDTGVNEGQPDVPREGQGEGEGEMDGTQCAGSVPRGGAANAPAEDVVLLFVVAAILGARRPIRAMGRSLDSAALDRRKLRR